jgi:hypothetical protein
MDIAVLKLYISNLVWADIDQPKRDKYHYAGQQELG